MLAQCGEVRRDLPVLQRDERHAWNRDDVAPALERRALESSGRAACASPRNANPFLALSVPGPEGRGLRFIALQVALVVSEGTHIWTETLRKVGEGDVDVVRPFDRIAERNDARPRERSAEQVRHPRRTDERAFCSLAQHVAEHAREKDLISEAIFGPDEDALAMERAAVPRFVRGQVGGVAVCFDTRAV